MSSSLACIGWPMHGCSILGLDGHLQVLNQQIGFYRNMVVALGLSVGAQVAGVTLNLTASGPPLPLLGFKGLAGAVLFAYRYRRFWSYFGAAVLDGLLTLKDDPQT